MTSSHGADQLKTHLYLSLWCRDGNLHALPAEQEVVQRPSQADLRVLAAPEPV